jgi:hypothetical protein
MSHDVLISITTKDILSEDGKDLLGETIVRGYDATTWFDIMDEMLSALKGSGFYPNREGFEDWLDQHFPQEYKSDDDEGVA